MKVTTVDVEAWLMLLCVCACVIQVLEKSESGWWYVRTPGQQEGWVPATSVHKTQPSTNTQPNKVTLTYCCTPCTNMHASVKQLLMACLLKHKALFSFKYLNMYSSITITVFDLADLSVSTAYHIT